MAVRQLHEQLALLRFADITPAELDANAECLSRGLSAPRQPPLRSLWFIPHVEHSLKGGIRTVFATAEFFSQLWKTENVFVVDDLFDQFDGGAQRALASSLRVHFPSLRFALHRFRRKSDSLVRLPSVDIAFCTLWTTAYLLARYNRCLRKFYFMQDFEPAFYEAGAVYGAIEATYRFGFSCIANTPGVAEEYRRYSEDVVFFIPGVDRAVFHPSGAVHSGSPQRIVFYGRPGNARNAFALGVAILKRLKREFGEGVDIVSVGAEWSEGEAGLEGVVRNLGMLRSLREVSDLYRSSALGIVFMFTPHPSYQPFEYMACGCVTATNRNAGTRWLLEDERNCLLLEPIPDLAAARITAALRNPDLLRKIRRGGFQTVEALEWATAFRKVAAFVLREPLPDNPPRRG